MRPRSLLLLATFMQLSLAVDAQEKERKTYWQDNQLNNQSRLGKTFEGFETEKEKASPTASPDSYLSSIREDLQQKSEAMRSNVVIRYDAQIPEQALTITRLEGGVLQLTLVLSALFEPNSVALKAGSIEVLERVARLVRENAGSTRLTLADQLDNFPGATDVHADRALCVSAFLAQATT